MKQDNLDWAAKTLAGRKTLPAASVSLALGTVACALLSPAGRVPAGVNYTFGEVERFAGIIPHRPSPASFASLVAAFDATLAAGPMKSGDDLHAASRTAAAIMSHPDAPVQDADMKATLTPFTDWREAGITAGVVSRDKADTITANAMPPFAADALGIQAELTQVAPYREEAKSALVALASEHDLKIGKEGFSL